MKTADAVRTEKPPTFAEFESADGWYPMAGVSMERVPVEAKFKTMYDGGNLYVLVETDLADDVQVRSFIRDGGVWNDECVDMTIAPGPSREVRYHLLYGIDPESRFDASLGIITDPSHPRFGKDYAGWNGDGWRTESRRGGGKWRSIMRLPFSDLGAAAPKPGDSWFINVGRIIKTGKDRKVELLMLWSPNFDSRKMCSPGAMGRLLFK